MQGFISIDEHSNEIALPSVAMIFDNKLFEEEISGYQTLNVTGRETLSYTLETSGSISGRDGELVYSKNLPSRVLTIQYKLEAKSNEEFQVKFRKLNWLLESEDDVEIRFRDDLDISYYGQLTNMEKVPPEKNNVVSTFEILCADPYKESSESEINGNPLQVFMNSPYANRPEEIAITLNSDTDKITVDNVTTGRHIILNGDYNANDEIIIRIDDKEITRNQQNIMSDLDYTETDFHRFLVNNGNKIQVTPSDSELKMKVRGRWK